MRIQCNGEIIASEWKWLYDAYEIPAFCPADVRGAIAALQPGEELVVEINSGGGDVFAGFECYSLLRRCEHETVAEVQSLAASAASTILQGCSVRRISPVGQVMIHNPSCYVGGNVQALAEATQMLEAGKESILNAYELRCAGKCDRKTLSDLMDRETWLTAQDAISKGLCDELLGDVPNSGTFSVRNSVGGVNPAELMARYESEVRAGLRQAAENHPVEADEKAPAEANDSDSTAQGAVEETDWTHSARLELEKIRFMEVNK